MFFIKVLINFSAISDIPSVYVESISRNHDFIDLSWNLLHLSIHILLGLQLDTSKMFWQTLVNVISLLYFKRTARTYLLKKWMTHNENPNPLLNWHINCISTRSAPQILSLKYEYTFCYSNFIIIGFVFLRLIVA